MVEQRNKAIVLIAVALAAVDLSVLMAVGKLGSLDSCLLAYMF